MGQILNEHGQERKSALLRLDEEEAAAAADRGRVDAARRHEPSQAGGTSGPMTFFRIVALILLTLFCFAMGTIPANERNGIATLFGPLFFVSAPFLYFLPTIEGALRKQPNQLSIAIVNIFLGWTLVGWVVAMAWACKSPAPALADRAAPATPIAAPPPTPKAASAADELTKLAVLKEKGLLTDDEFAHQKAKLLA